MSGRPHCARCGRFVGHADVLAEFIPDSHFGPERATWLCRGCAAAERQAATAQDPAA